MTESIENPLTSAFKRQFRPLAAVQLVELGIAVKGNLGVPLETAISVALNVRLETMPDDAKALLVGLKLDATGSHEGAVRFTAQSQLIGRWPALGEFDVNDANLLNSVSVEAAPLLYVLARQHLVDLLAKAGIHAENWPFNPGVAPLIARKEPLKSAKKSTETKRDKAKGSKGK